MLIRRKIKKIKQKQDDTEALEGVQSAEIGNDAEIKEQPEEEIVETLDIDNFDFLQREERRRGDRRRGYRRIDDRNLVSRAQVEAVSIKEEAVKDGYNAGLEKAKEDIENLREELKRFFTSTDKVVEMLSKDILEIAVDVAQTIIKKEVEQDNNILLETVADILKTSAKTDDRITLNVSEEDAEFVKMSVPQILSIAQTEAKISVKVRDNIEKGSVIVETSSGIVDASFKTQLDVIREAFKGI